MANTDLPPRELQPIIGLMMGFAVGLALGFVVSCFVFWYTVSGRG